MALDHPGVPDHPPPGLNVLHQQMHHQVLRQLLGVEVLQQEGAVAVAEIGDLVVAAARLEAEVEVECPALWIVLRRDEGFDLDGVQRAHE
ncbi:hypothetical protein D3C76_1671370 [compost metagenome]